MAVRITVFIVVAYVVYVTWHEQFGRFMFFEELDPPALDPHRTEHLRDAYYLIYGILGAILGLVASVRARLLEAILTIVIGITFFLCIRYRGIPSILDRHSEEGYFGLRAIAIASLVVLAVISAVRAALRRTAKQSTGAEQGSVEQPSNAGETK